MAILKTLYPKGGVGNPVYFDLSDFLTVNYDIEYEKLRLEITYDTTGSGSVKDLRQSIRLNGREVSSTVDAIYVNTGRRTKIFDFDPGSVSDISNVISEVVLTRGTGYSFSIISMGIISEPYEPILSATYTHTAYVNYESKLSFKGNKYCTGMSVYFDGTGKTIDMQANPGTLVVNGNNTTGEVTLPHGYFVEGENTSVIRGLNHSYRGTASTNTTHELNATIYPVKVTNFKFDNTKPSKDEPIKCTWVASPRQTKYQMKYKSQSGVETVLGEMASNTQSHIFGANILPEGKVTIGVRIFDGYYWSDWVETDITTYAFKVISLEPNSVAQNKDKPIKAEWAGNDPYTKYEFEYKCNKETKKITGTTGNFHNFTPNFFDVETVTLRARLYNGYVWSEWKEVTFFTYGKPATPTLTTPAEYETSTPTFTWTSVGQVSYRLQVLKDNIVILDSGDVYSSSKEHTFATFLDNNITYTAKLSISNQYEYASDWATKNFKIVFEELQKPAFDMFSDDKLGRILFNIYNAEGQTNFKHCELYRREYGEEKWLRVATNLPLISTYTDYTCRSGVLYEYKAMAIAKQGGNTDSETGLKEVKLRNTMLSDTDDLDNYVVLIHNPKKSRAFKKETHVMNYNGTSKPWFEFGESKFQAIKVNFTVDENTLDKILDLYYSNNILLFRDNRGKKLYGHIDGDVGVDDAEFMKYTVNFNFTETNYNEGVLV